MLGARFIIPLLLMLVCGACDNSKRNDQNVSFTIGKDTLPGIPFGFFYEGDTFHLFYETNDTSGSEKKCWSHMVSNDLIKWSNVPLTFIDCPDHILSGCVVYDKDNTSGLGAGETPLIAFYSEISEDTCSHSIAFSLNKGVTWKKHSNPVLKTAGKFVEPKVFRHDESSQWIMCIAGRNELALYASPDCIHWQYLSKIDHVCTRYSSCCYPELFPINIPGSHKTKWVLLVSDMISTVKKTKYYVGDFDGKKFKISQIDSETANFLVDYGEDLHSAILCRHVPEDRQIILGWKKISGSSKSLLFTPRELKLIEEPSYDLLVSSPVDEIQQLYGKKRTINITVGSNSTNEYKNILNRDRSFVLNLSIDNTQKGVIGFPSAYGIKLKNSLGEYLTIMYDCDNKLLMIDQNDPLQSLTPHYVSYITGSKNFEWQVMVNENSIDFFADHNRVSVANELKIKEPFTDLAFFSENGPIEFNCQLYSIKYQ